MRGLGFVFLKYIIHHNVNCSGYGGEIVHKHGFIDGFHPQASGMRESVLICPPIMLSSNDNLDSVVEFYLVKIGDGNPHETLPNSFALRFFSFDVFEWGGQFVGNNSFELLINDFNSVMTTATCITPTASESIIYFGSFNQQNVQAKVAGAAITMRKFVLTLSCPVLSYGLISFFVEPKYGKADGNYGNQGIMKIAQGTGMATGVGVRLELNNGSDTAGWANVIYRTNPPYNTEYGWQYGKYRVYSRPVSFRASLVRLPEPVQAGQIKAAALIHIRYN